MNIPDTMPTDRGKNNDTISLIMLGLLIIYTTSKTLNFANNLLLRQKNNFKNNTKLRLLS